MVAAEREQYLARLRQLVAAGASLRAAARQLRRPKTTVQEWAKAAGVAGQATRLSSERRAEIGRRLRQGQTIYRVAKAVGVSTRTVWRRYLQQLRRLIGGEYLPTREWRCPACGALVNTTRCVADGTPKPAPKRAKTARRIRPGKSPPPPR